MAKRALVDPMLRLAALGADEVPHVNGSLGAHLRGTYDLLKGFGHRDALCLAGLYHSVYGTAGFHVSLVEVTNRQSIIDVIGAEAEALVYLFGACDRPIFHPRIGTPDQCRFVDGFADCERTITIDTLRDFCELTVANELELASRNVKFRARHASSLRQFFERMNGLLSVRAAEAYTAILGTASRVATVK